MQLKMFEGFGKEKNVRKDAFDRLSILEEVYKKCANCLEKEWKEIELSESEGVN